MPNFCYNEDGTPRQHCAERIHCRACRAHLMPGTPDVCPFGVTAESIPPTGPIPVPKTPVLTAAEYQVRRAACQACPHCYAWGSMVEQCLKCTACGRNLHLSRLALVRCKDSPSRWPEIGR